MVRFIAIAVLFVSIAGCTGSRSMLTANRPHAVYVPAHDCEYCSTPARPPKHVLSVSGGGLYGAYLAGFLNGWTNTGTRPEFDVVTGISTGSLVGLCAFLGPEYDQLAKVTYTTAHPQEIYTLRSWYSIPFSASIASNAPFRERIDKSITPEIVERVAQAHRAGRRFYVGSTNIETRRLAIWDMGSLACRGTPESVELFKTVLVASCAVPGVFPPTPITIRDEKGERIEWHIDGGATAPMFVPRGIITKANNEAAGGMTIYGFISGKYFVDEEAIKPKVLSILRSTVPAVTHAHARSELASIYHLSKLAGAGFVCTALPNEFNVKGTIINISTEDQNRLFLEGYRFGSSGPVWDPAPPPPSDEKPRQ